MQWGLLGPERLLDLRRIRTLGLSACVRHFNEKAVPGMGTVWFGKQVLLAVLGVQVAQQARESGARVRNAEVTDAIEALACWLALQDNAGKRDLRLRGRVKLLGRTDWCFEKARQPTFYVTNPMRMSTVQALPALGLVESDGARFNAFAVSPLGKRFVELAFDSYRPFKRSVDGHLTRWVRGETTQVDTEALRSALSPLEPMDRDALRFLKDCMCNGKGGDAASRRHDALDWIEALRQDKPGRRSAGAKPVYLDHEHWRDITAGAAFFRTRRLAIAVLNILEAFLRLGGDARLNGSGAEKLLKHAKAPLEALSLAAKAFPSKKDENPEADRFCRECTQDEPASVLRALVARDGRVLRLHGDMIESGPAFSRPAPVDQDATDDDVVDPPQLDALFPADVSDRLHHLYLLNLDFHGKLGEWLAPAHGDIET